MPTDVHEMTEDEVWERYVKPAAEYLQDQRDEWWARYLALAFPPQPVQNGADTHE